jgi:hypothetical protein
MTDSAPRHTSKRRSKRGGRGTSGPPAPEILDLARLLARQIVDEELERLGPANGVRNIKPLRDTRPLDGLDDL